MILVRDNFITFPTIVRQWAINQRFYNAKEFTEKHGKFTDWPGRRTEHVMDLDQDYANTVLSNVANIARTFYGLSNISIRSYFQLTTEEDGDSWVHQDNNVLVAGILYLNINPPANSGTTLYRCKDVAKWESFMSSGEGYNTLKTINSQENKALYQELFEPRDTIANVFNRLVMYPGTEYHKSNNYFGSSPQDGRLTQVFFISQE